MPQPQQYQPSQPLQQPQSSPPPPPVRPGFSMQDLVSEEALPEWLRQASAESAQPTQRQPVPGANPYSPPPTYPAAYPPMNQPTTPAYGGGFAPVPAEEPPAALPDASAFPPLESAGNYQAPQSGGMSANSLLDPNALPSWLSGQQGHAPSDGLRGGDGLRAQSLVDETALPGWLRAEPASSPVQAPAAPPPASVPAWGGYPAAPPPATAPAWGGYPAAPAPAAPVAPASPAGPYGGYAGMQPPPPAATNGQQGFSASSLVDPNALPDWMRAQGGAGMPQPGAMQHPGAPMPAPGLTPAQGLWSASDLIDQAMLPAWVRESEAATPAAPPQATGANNFMPGMAPMGPMPIGIDGEATRERTSRVAAPRPPMRAQSDYDFNASHAGIAQRHAPPRGNPPPRPLDEHEKPAWLREDPQDGYGRDSMYGQDSMAAYAPPPARQERQDRNSRSWNGYNDQDDYGAQSSRYSRAGQRGRMPGGQTGQTGQSWGAPDGYESSPWSRPRPRGYDESAPPKKRWNDFFRFLRRG